MAAMAQSLPKFLRLFLGSIRDLAPIVAVVAFFQLVVIEQPFPDLATMIGGLFLVIVGLTLFIQGLEIGLFPIGENMAHGLARRGNLLLLLSFSFCLGFGTTIAEPALVAVAGEAARAARAAGTLAGAPAEVAYALALRYTVAVAVGLALIVGVLRILKGWPIQYMIMGGYALVIAMTPLAPAGIVGIAYDSGGVTTSTITVPLVTALGVGLASVIRGRNPLLDGFGLIAFASLTPMMFVMVFGMLWGPLWALLAGV